MPRISASERSATRQRLVDAGKAEFAERGLAGARFDEISLAAGNAKGTIYNYFASKEALFFTIVEEWCGQLVEGFTLDPTIASARAQLLEVARLDVEFARKDPDLARVVINQMPALMREHRAAVESAIEPGIELMTNAIDAGQRGGDIRADWPARTVARLFLTALSGFEQEALGDDSGVELDDVVGLVDTCFLEGIST